MERSGDRARTSPQSGTVAARQIRVPDASRTWAVNSPAGTRIRERRGGRRAGGGGRGGTGGDGTHPGRGRGKAPAPARNPDPPAPAVIRVAYLSGYVVLAALGAALAGRPAVLWARSQGIF